MTFLHVKRSSRIDLTLSASDILVRSMELGIFTSHVERSYLRYNSGNKTVGCNFMTFL